MGRGIHVAAATLQDVAPVAETDSVVLEFTGVHQVPRKSTETFSQQVNHMCKRDILGRKAKAHENSPYFNIRRVGNEREAKAPQGVSPIFTHTHTQTPMCSANFGYLHPEFFEASSHPGQGLHGVHVALGADHPTGLPGHVQ